MPEKTLESFLKEELGCESEPMYEVLKNADDALVRATAWSWERQNEKAIEKFYLLKERTREFVQKTRQLVSKYFIGEGYVISLEYPKTNNVISLIFLFTRNGEKIFVALTFETTMAVVVVSPEL